jgi:hypothetical protein
MLAIPASLFGSIGPPLLKRLLEGQYKCHRGLLLVPAGYIAFQEERKRNLRNEITFPGPAGFCYKV